MSILWFARWSLAASLTGSWGNAVVAEHYGRRAELTSEHSERDSVPLSSITTDTGAFAPGNVSFARFTRPELCIGAVEGARSVGRRSVASQVANIFADADSSMHGDSLPRAAVAVAQACGTRFTVANTAPSDLNDLFTLALMAAHDSVAAAVVNRRLSLAKTEVERADVLQDAIDGYLGAEPIRATAAESAIARIDAFGIQAQPFRVRAHAALLRAARARFHASYMRQEAERIIALTNAVPTATRNVSDYYRPLMDAYAALAELAYIEAPDSVPFVVLRAKQNMGQFSPQIQAMPDNARPFNFQTASDTAVRKRLLPFDATLYAGEQLPPVTASSWFPSRPTTWPPGRGHASLVIYGGAIANPCARQGVSNFSDVNPASGCAGLYTNLPAWKKEYGERLTITLIAQTAGYTAQGVARDPATEADTLQWFFHDQLHLPVTFGVVNSLVRQFPAPDGRRQSMDTSFYGRLWQAPRWNYTSSQVMLFYDPRGTLLYVGEDDVSNPILEQLIVRTLRTDGPGAADHGHP